MAAASVQVDYFSYGPLTVVLSYTLSALGSFLGLVCTARARNLADRGRRARWLLLGAWAIGGTGIWTMHFMAMIGFGVADYQIRYDPVLTLASLLTAIVVVAIGLFIVGFGRPTAIKILAAGLFTGVGVAAMHYTGMAAMRMPADVTYELSYVAVSVLIAVVAATVALWFTVTVRRGMAIFVAALIMGVAVNGMHYTAMYGLRLSTGTRPVSGLLPITFLGPIVIFVAAVIVVLLFASLSRSGLDGGEGETTVIPADFGLGPGRPTSDSSGSAVVNRHR